MPTFGSKLGRFCNLSIRFAAACWCIAFALICTAQEAEPKASENPTSEETETFDRAREAFRDVIERVWTPKSRLTNGPHVKASFREVVTEAGQATVRVRSDGADLSMGGIVGPDGWVLTKASRLKGQVTVRLADGREFDGRTVGVDRGYDLAVLKLDAKNLPTLKLEEGSAPAVGSWVATVGVGKDPVAVGVVSVAPREIIHRPGILGIQLDDPPEGAKGGAIVVKVFPSTGAEEAGILINDVVTAVNGQPVRSREELIQEVRRYSPGDTIEVGVVRGDQNMTIKATLTGRNRVMRMNRSEYQNSLGSGLSQRRFGFPEALQHDTVLDASDCGGPIVDLNGRVVGFNLARAGRTESYAIPTAKLRELLFELMSGRKTPERNGKES